MISSFYILTNESHLKRKSVAKLHRTDNRILLHMSHCINIQIWTNIPIFLKHSSTPDPSECFQRRLHLFEKFGARQCVPIHESDLKAW